MQSKLESSDGTIVYRHGSGAEISVKAVGFAAMHGGVSLEGSLHDERIYLNGYPYERKERPVGESSPDVSHPWPEDVLTRRELAELCEVVEREAADEGFDYVGSQTGYLYVAYDDQGSLGRDVDSEERIFANPQYQATRIGFLISHVSARGVDDGQYRVFGYNPDGPSAAERVVPTHGE